MLEPVACDNAGETQNGSIMDERYARLVLLKTVKAPAMESIAGAFADRDRALRVRDGVTSVVRRGAGRRASAAHFRLLTSSVNCGATWKRSPTMP